MTVHLPQNGSAMRRLFAFAVGAVFGLLLPDLAAAQSGITVVRAEGTVRLDEARLLALPRREIQASAHDKSQRYEGSELAEVLRAGGVEPPAQIRGGALRKVVAVHAADGYVTAFAWAELDASLGNKQVWLVDRAGGAALPAGEGPWRLVVPSETRPTRWVRQVLKIVVADAP